MAHLASHVEGGQRAYEPSLEGADEAAHVPSARAQVEHHIGHPLARTVVGVLTAARAREYRQPVGIEQVRRLGRHAGGVERRMLEQPDEFARASIGYRQGVRFHGGDGGRVGDLSN